MENRGGDDAGDPSFPKCPHCERDLHGLPITQKIAKMWSRGQYDEQYSAAEDDSPVVCSGSDFIGPMPPQPYTFTSVYPNWQTWFGGWTIPDIEQLRLRADAWIPVTYTRPHAPWLFTVETRENEQEIVNVSVRLSEGGWMNVGSLERD